VGDLAVPKEMRRFGEAFYGRQAAYLVALAAADHEELEKALARNIFEGVGNNGGPARLAVYTRAAMRQCEAQGQDALLRGEIVFPNPEAIAHG
jgi:cytochrome b pre-mRNA-processing protein 3